MTPVKYGQLECMYVEFYDYQNGEGFFLSDF